MPATAACCTAASVAARKAAATQSGRSAAAKESFKAKQQLKAEDDSKAEERGPCSKCMHKVLDFLDQTWLQTLQYIAFLVAFQSLTGTIRNPAEFYFDKYLTDTFIINTFDAAHNRFEDIRRVSDIWEWSQNVLTPGLFSNADQGEMWPDGDGLFSLDGATPLSTSEVVDSFNVVSFAEGIVLKQVRAAPLASKQCYRNHTCYAAGNSGDDDTADYGFGASEGQFKWWSSTDLGANPSGVISASPISQRAFPSSGYVALFMPFFSDTLLPDENGTHAQVTDHRPSEATPTNGRDPTYYCARSSFNGHEITQRCNPDPSTNHEVARTLFAEMLATLKKGHWIDHRTRLLSLSMQMRNNNAGVRFRVNYMFEVTQMGAVIPSYDMETLIDEETNTSNQRLWMTISLVLTCWFALLEGVEVLQSGPMKYLNNVWNVMDWSNFALFGVTYWLITNALALNERDKQGANCVAKICTEFGYYDMWEVFDTARNAKLFMSICVCIQLLKIIKFTNVVIPKMSLMTRVLSKGCYDLLFFGIIFGVSMFAFCMLFYIQLGSFMDDFYSQTSSMIALAKALFGDFPFDEIVDNSRGYLNAILFLVYLFVAVFILLSMFLAILGEAQAAVRDEENSLKELGLFPNQYGFIGEASEWLSGKIEAFHNRNRTKEQQDAADAAAAAAADASKETNGLDSALNTALSKMQKRLDVSVQKSVASLEQRMLRQLGALDRQLADSTGGTGRTHSREHSDGRDRIKRSHSTSPVRSFKGQYEHAGKMTNADYERMFHSHKEPKAGCGRTIYSAAHEHARSTSSGATRKVSDGAGGSGSRRRSIKAHIDISPAESPLRAGGGPDRRASSQAHADTLAC